MWCVPSAAYRRDHIYDHLCDDEPHQLCAALRFEELLGGHLHETSARDLHSGDRDLHLDDQNLVDHQTTDDRDLHSVFHDSRLGDRDLHSVFHDSRLSGRDLHSDDHDLRVDHQHYVDASEHHHQPSGVKADRRNCEDGATAHRHGADALGDHQIGGVLQGDRRVRQTCVDGPECHLDGREVAYRHPCVGAKDVHRLDVDREDLLLTMMGVKDAPNVERHRLFGGDGDRVDQV
jgi:hypothetical protein